MAATGGSWDKGKVGVKGHFNPSRATMESKRAKLMKRAAYDSRRASAAEKKIETKKQRRSIERQTNIAGELRKKANASKMLALDAITTNMASKKLPLRDRGIRPTDSQRRAFAREKAIQEKGGGQQFSGRTKFATELKQRMTAPKSTGKKAATAKKKSTGGGAKKARSRNSKA